MSEATTTNIVPLAAMLQDILTCPPFLRGFELQIAAKRTFYQLAARIAGTECPMSPPAEEAFGIERNFFSTFFLAVTQQVVGESGYLPLYAMVNQGMRAWVTACDNILDDEYKDIFSFTFPERGLRMRSILTLLLADRVVNEFIAETYGDGAIIKAAGRTSLRALVPSALQECDEEQRPVPVLQPGEILRDIHSRKTADLFAAPLAMPLAMETVDPARAEAAMKAVRSFGLACQIIDDIKDLADDVCSGRHNLLVSITSNNRSDDNQWLRQLRNTGKRDWTAWERFPAAAGAAAEIAMERFQSSFDALAAIGIALSQTQRDAVVTCIFALLNVPRESATTAVGVS